LSEDQLKRNAELKLWIENRIAALQEEVGMLKEALVVVDGSLRASSFRPASEVTGGEPIPEIRELRKDKGGETIAVAQITTAKVKIEPVAEAAFKVDTPPFKSFLLGKILSGMKESDEQAAKSGRLKRGDELRYSFLEKNGRLSSITVENYREKERLSEILSTVSWTLSRMMEK